MPLEGQVSRQMALQRRPRQRPPGKVTSDAAILAPVAACLPPGAQSHAEGRRLGLQRACPPPGSGCLRSSLDCAVSGYI